MKSTFMMVHYGVCALEPGMHSIRVEGYEAKGRGTLKLSGFIEQEGKLKVFTRMPIFHRPPP